MTPGSGSPTTSEHVSLQVADDEDQSYPRSSFLRHGLGAAGGILAGGVAIAGLPSLAASAPSPAQDFQVLNFALRLEYLQEAFYRRAARATAVRGELRRFVAVVRDHEAAHIDYLKAILGKRAVKRPTFDFGNALASERRFTSAAVLLEDLGVAAYNGQAANLTSAGLEAAAKVASVDARHAAWIRAIVGRRPAPQPTDQPKSASQVLADLEGTGFEQ